MNFDAVFHRVYPQLYRYLHRLTGSPDAAADVAQESFTRLLAKPLPEEDARRWLFTVATNLVRDGARTARTRERLLTANPVTSATPAQPDELAERRERIARVREALECLPERDRTILLMRQEGFRYEEIAEVVGVAPGSVGTLLARATRRFAQVYRREEGDESSG